MRIYKSKKAMRLVSTGSDSLLSLTHQSLGRFRSHTASSPDGRIIVHFYHGSTTFAEQFITLAEQDLLCQRYLSPISL